MLEREKLQLYMFGKVQTQNESHPITRVRRGTHVLQGLGQSSLPQLAVIAYGARHGHATNALPIGVDPISVAHLMGHRSPAMVAQVYIHLSQNHEFLKKQAINACPSAPATTVPPQGATATDKK